MDLIAVAKEIGQLNVSQFLAVFAVTWPIVRGFIQKEIAKSTGKISDDLHSLTRAMSRRIDAVEHDVKQLKDKEKS